MMFNNTLIFKNLNIFKIKNRVNVELLLLYYVIKQFDPKILLEIGFSEGCSFGVMLEAAAERSELTSVDIVINQTLFDSIYNDSSHVRTKKVNLLTMPSSKFEDSENRYDFILVDGDHTLPTAYRDLIKASKLINLNGIIMIDDYHLNDVDQAIDQFLKLETGFVPFLISEQSVYFHHVSHNAENFIDNELGKFAPFCDLSNVDYKSFLVKKVSCLPAITNHNDIFSLVCNHYALWNIWIKNLVLIN